MSLTRGAGSKKKILSQKSFIQSKVEDRLLEQGRLQNEKNQLKLKAAEPSFKPSLNGKSMAMASAGMGRSKSPLVT